MKRIFLLMVALLLSAGTTPATTEKWTASWDNFSFLQADLWPIRPVKRQSRYI
jgi:hypothetical protein